MADYNLGQLYLELDVRGEADLEQRLGGIRTHIDAASDANKTLNQHSRKTYADLKALAGAANEAAPKLQGAFEGGTLSAYDYQKALQLVRKVQDTAGAGGERLRKTNLETIHMMVDAEKAARAYARELANLGMRATALQQDLYDAVSGGGQVSDEMLASVREVNVELAKQAKLLGDGDFQGRHFANLKEQLEDLQTEALGARGALERLNQVPVPDVSKPAAAPRTDVRPVEGPATNPLAYQEAAKARYAEAEAIRVQAEETGRLEEATRKAKEELRKELGILDSAADRARLATEASDAFYASQRRIADVSEDVARALDYDFDGPDYFEQAAEANAYADSMRDAADAKRELNEEERRAPPAAAPPPPPNTPNRIPSGFGARGENLRELGNRFDIIKGQVKGGERALEDVEQELAELQAEIISGSKAWEGNSTAMARWLRLSGQVGAFRMNPGKDWGLADADEMIGELENEFKSLNAELTRSGVLSDELRDKFARVRDIADGASVGFGDGTSERSRLDTVAGKSEKTVVDFDAKAALDAQRTAAAALEEQLKALRAAFDTNDYSAEDLRNSLAQLEAQSIAASEAARELGLDTSRYSAIASGAAKLAKQVRLDPGTNEELTTFANRLQIIEGLYRSGEIKSGQFDKQLEGLIASIMKQARALDVASDEYREYIALAGKAGNIKTRVGQEELRSSFFSKEFILGNALSNVYGELGIRAVMATGEMVAGMDDAARATERAHDGTIRFNETVRESGESMAQVRADVDATAQKYFMLSTNAEGAAATLLKAGYSSEQTASLLDAVGATAVQRGTDVKEAFAEIANAGNDVEGALTQATGATEGYDRALLRAAAGQANMVGNLSKTDRQAALVASVMGASSDALRDYGRNVDGAVGAQMRQTAAAEIFRRELGEELAPTVIRVTELGTSFIKMATGWIGPLVSAGESVAGFVSHFTLMETLLIGLAMGGPGAAAGIASLGTAIVNAGGGAAGLLALLGSWPVILAALGVAAVATGAYFLDLRTDTQKLADSMDELEAASGVGVAAFDSLKSATDKEGLQAAVSSLAATMSGEAASAFRTFASDAIETSETTVGAIDLIYAYLAEKRKAAIQDALSALQPVINDLEGRVAANSEFEDSGNADKLKAAQDRQKELERIRDESKAVMDANMRGGDSDTYFDAQDRYKAALSELEGVYAEVGRLQNDLWQRGGRGAGEAAADQQELNEALAKEATLQQNLNQITATPGQFIESSFQKLVFSILIAMVSKRP